MGPRSSQPSKTTLLVAAAQAGDETATAALLERTCERLRRLTRKMLNDHPRLRRWEETDDVLQGALLRLHRALSQAKLESSRHFFNLAALQIRRELLDLSRHHFGALGPGAKHYSDPQGRAADDAEAPLDRLRAFEPQSLESWGEFHAAVEALPEEAREVFNLVWYDGLSQQEAAEVLGVSARTVKRRWQEAKVALHQALDGEAPT
ncbi:MAG TPA: sigma-70 family RNA polymerase sigma factor [Pirellulales bacterium]|nr:sigma-70 family RNA polymerase sigma factor [Pirellulales bacterium]